jgi:hypothetical protein
MSDIPTTTTVQVAFTVDESAICGEEQVRRVLSTLDMAALAEPLGQPDAETAGWAMRTGAAVYARVVAEAAGELRTHSHIGGTSLLVCTTGETFAADVPIGQECEPEELVAALSPEVAESLIGDLGAFLLLAEHTPELAAAAGFVCLGMPSLGTIRAHATPPEAAAG